MELFLELVPSRMRKELAEHGEVRELIEVVMDLGRKPIARFPSGDWIISQEPVDLNDLNHAVSKVKFINRRRHLLCLRFLGNVKQLVLLTGGRFFR